jgi:hypothetical protein
MLYLHVKHVNKGVRGLALKTRMIRGVDEKAWKQARSKAVSEELSMGQVINFLLQAWLSGKIRIKGRGRKR